MTQMDLPLIDVHTHIGHLPGAVGDVYTAEDLCYICDHEGARFMLVSSASATTVTPPRCFPEREHWMSIIAGSLPTGSLPSMSGA